MPAERYYADVPLDENEVVRIEGDEAHHLIKVMRGRPGDMLELVNGKGVLALATVLSVGKSGVDLKVLERVAEAPKPTPIIIAQALPKLNRIDVIVEKGTELGMTALYFFPGELSEKSEISALQEKRFKNLAISAMKQCGCLYLPEIEIRPRLKEWKTIPHTGFYGDVDPKAPHFLKALQEGKSSGIIFFVGPEKGFSVSETHHLKNLNVKGVNLHPNILRTDTASLCVLSQLHALI